MSSIPSWPLNIYYIMTIISFPIYFLVTVCLIRLRYCSSLYRTTFYTILLQHCLADLLTIFIFTLIWAIRMLPGLKEFYFTYQEYYIAAGTYNSIYYFLYIRCFGIVLLSLHRYIVIILPMSKISQIVQHLPSYQIILFYWTIPTLISIVVLKDTNFSYDSIETMDIVAERSVITRNTLMALIVVSLTCLICSISYGALFMFLRKHSLGLSRSLRRETHLALQVLFLLLAFFVIFIYYALQNYFSRTQNSGPIYTMRAIYPIANGILSYINPYCIILLNSDFSKQFKNSLICREIKVSEVKRSTNQTPATIMKI
ncbi:unnamed protein product [Caenorhabditis angaria]|uniref:G-protein coupled receptors family 1 profile domain-containing protein n=1 Tax=Caenorhabditis angaria TaxID=860376 RepID=A0A9P1IKL2_9PELO|nr:unnamed protein product [Caenorhabditis angaria]